MQTIELKSKTDKHGKLKIEHNLNTPGRNVSVLILSDEHLDNEEMEWEDSILKDPSFDFLKDSSEDIYTLNDGDPINA